MEAGQFEQYQAISKLYKEVVDSITTLDLPQLKLYLVNLQKRIDNKQQPILNEYKNVKEMLDQIKEAKGKVPLHFAAASGNLEVLKHLIETVGVDLKVRDKEGNSPFFTAIEHGHLPLVQYFIEEAKCSSNEVKEGNISTLHLAANHDHTDIISYLVSKGADVEKLSIYGKPINWAVGSGHLEATKTLLGLKANPDGDSSGSSIAPLILAIDHQRQDIYELLLQHGANPKMTDPAGYSALHLAAQKGNLKIVKDLVERGAELSLEVEGKTPLYLAFEQSRWEVVNWLKGKMPNHAEIESRWKAQAEKVEKSKVEPDHERAEEIKNIGNKFYVAKQYTQALEEYSKALSFDPDNEVVHRNIAACQLALQQYDLALFHCQEAKKKDPKNIKTVYREAQAYLGLNNLIDAAGSMWECCTIEPNNQNFRHQFLKITEQAKAEHKSKGK